MPLSEPAFIHPLLGADGAWAGYCVEFAPGVITDEVLVHLQQSQLFADFDRRAPWFLPARAIAPEIDALDTRIVSVFPAIPSDEIRAELKQQEATLRQSMRKVALSASPEQPLPGSGAWDYLLMATSHARSLPAFTLMGLATRTTLVTLDVHTHNDRDWSLANACSLTTGEFLQTRSSDNTKPDITRLKLLKLLALIVEDAETDALHEVFREEQKLSYSLLRLVNSAAISPPSPINSFSQAINLLGRRKLQRWLQLLVYSDPNNGQHPNPLLQKAAARGRLLELLAPRVDDGLNNGYSGDLAFMIGSFSLLDVLLNVAMPEILSQLPLPLTVHEALAEHKGPLGELLATIAAADRRDLRMAELKLKALGIDPGVYLDAQLEAFGWASKIRPLG